MIDGPTVGVGDVVSAGLDGAVSVGPVGPTGFAALVWASVGVVLCVFSYVVVVYVRELRTA